VLIATDQFIRVASYHIHNDVNWPVQLQHLLDMSSATKQPFFLKKKKAAGEIGLLAMGNSNS